MSHGNTGGKAKLSVGAIVFMLLVSVMGGGFGIEDLVSSVGPGMTLIIFIILPFVWSFPFGLSSAELSSAYPTDGGMYIWAQKGLGEKAGFVAGWAYSICAFVEPATFAVLTANYVKQLLPGGAAIEAGTLPYWAICTVLIIIFAIVNIIGIKLVSNLATVITVLACLPFIALIILSFTQLEYSVVSPIVPEGMGYLEAAGNGILVGIWFNTGFETISTMSGDIEDGSKKVPKAIAISVPIVSIMYILWVMPALGAVGNWQDWSSEGPLSFVEIGAAVGGPVLRMAFILAGTLASMVILCEYILAYSYLLKSFAEQGQFFQCFAKLHPKFGTPYVAIIITSLVSIGLCTSSSFLDLVYTASILYAVPVIMMFISNIKLRLKQPEVVNSLDFKVPLPSKVYIIWLCFPIVVYAASVFTDAWQLGLGLTATSIPAYFFFKKLYKGGRNWGGMNK
jgi:amino acid transporter